MDTLTVPPGTSSHDELQELLRLEVPQLLGLLNDCFVGICERIQRACLIVKALDMKGYRLEDIRPRIRTLPDLRRINRGQLLADLVVKLDGDRERLAILSTLPARGLKNSQESLLSGQRLTTVVPAGADSLTTMEADPFCQEMTPLLLGQVIDAELGAVRTPEQQRVLIHAERKESAKPLPQKVGPLALDEVRKGAVAGGVFITLEDMERAVAILRRRRNRP